MSVVKEGGASATREASPTSTGSSLAQLDQTKPLGLIAGNKSFPLEFAMVAKQRGFRVIAVAHVGETDPVLEQHVERCVWIRLGQLGKIVTTLREAGVKQATFAGGISRIKLFGGVRLDMRGLFFLSRLGSIRDDAILKGLAAEIERAGIEVFSAGVLLERSVPRAGVLTQRDLTKAERSDARFGWEMAKHIGRLDIGQTVAVSHGMVVAVEAIEGTDQAIMRAGELTRAVTPSLLARMSPLHAVPQALVVVKVPKPQQDLRIDLPTIGIQTVESMALAGATALIIEAGKTIMLEPEDLIRRANQLGIAIVSVSCGEDL